MTDKANEVTRISQTETLAHASTEAGKPDADGIILSVREQEHFTRMSEDQRTYRWPDGSTCAVVMPRYINVTRKPDGDSHRLILKDGTRVYIPAGWTKFEFSGQWDMQPKITKAPAAPVADQPAPGMTADDMKAFRPAKNELTRTFDMKDGSQVVIQNPRYIRKVGGVVTIVNDKGDRTEIAAGTWDRCTATVQEVYVDGPAATPTEAARAANAAKKPDSAPPAATPAATKKTKANVATKKSGKKSNKKKK